jgi:phage terminase large subunit-like protein
MKRKQRKKSRALPTALHARRGTVQPCRLPKTQRRKRRRSNGSQSEPSLVRDYLAIARTYALDVLEGRIPACQPVRQAIQRQERDRRRAANDASWPYAWSELHAAAVCTFAESMVHVEGKWPTPTLTLQPWQVWLLTTLFGWRYRDDQARRRFNDCYIEVARKNGKSVLAAIVMLYCFLEEQENGPQIKIAATTRSQTDAVFLVAKKIVSRLPWLRARYGLQVFANSITCDVNSGSFQPINSKSSSQDGLNPHAYTIDELHAHKDRGLFDVLYSARGSRFNPLSLSITTAGYNMLGVAYEQRSFLAKVLQEIFNADTFFGVIYTLDEGDDWTDEATWRKANPGLGITPQREEMRAYAQKAQHSDESAGEFKTKRLNLWLSSASAWLSMDAWQRCAETTLTIEAFAGAPCVVGVDIAERDDLTAVVVVFERDGLLYAFPKCFLPLDVVEARSRAVPAYRLWAASGVLVTTAGPMTDLPTVEAYVRALVAGYQVRQVVIEQFGGQYLASTLLAAGIPALLQGKTAKYYTPPAKELEARLEHGKFRHDGNSCLTWMASNAVVTRGVDGSLLPKKQTANSPNKIDGLDALLLAMGELLATPAEPAYDPQIFILEG